MAGNPSNHMSRSHLTTSVHVRKQQSIEVPNVQARPIPRPQRIWISLWVLTILLNALIVFVVLPKASPQIRGLYSENQYADGYDQLAANLAAGNGYRFYPDTAQTLMREPGYPLLLAGTYELFGSDFRIVKLLNMALAFCTAYLMICIGHRISANSLLIFGAPLIFLLHPETLIAESRGGVEIFFGFMLALFMFTVYRLAGSERWSAYALSGAVLGATLLVRSSPLLFPLLLFGYLAFSERKSSNLVVLTRNFSVMVVTMCLVISPWVVRNYLLTKNFVPTASVLGVAAQTGLYMATHQEIGNVQVDVEAAMERNRLAQEFGRPFRPGYYQYFYSSSDELEFSQYLSRRVADEYKAFPLLFLRTLGLNLLKFWCGAKTVKSVALAGMLQFPFLALAATGVVLCVRNGRKVLIAPLVLLCVYTVAVSAPILAQARYCEPLIPFMAIMSGIPLITFIQRVARGRYAFGDLLL